MKEMCTRIPRGSCPNCYGRQFIVYESDQNLYLTDRDGDVLDSQELYYYATGMCCKCGKKYEMLPTTTGFIPLTKLRKILFDYSPHKTIEPVRLTIDNPMEMK